MTNTIQQPSIFKSSNTLQSLQEKWELVNDISGGTFVMRQAGQKYLPQNPKESSQKYRDRLYRTTLTDQYSKSIARSVGLATARRMNVVLPDQLMSMTLNVDGDGTSLESFTQTLLSNTINYGIMYILVDVPSSNATNLHQQNKENISPYFIDIKPTQLLDLSVDYINNKSQLTYFRYYEELTSYNDSSINDSESVQQVREFILTDNTVSFNIYRKDKDGKEYIADSGILSINYIPIIPVYGRKVGRYLGEPVLENMAHLCVRLWEQTSDLNTNVRYGLTPILALKGIQANTDPETGRSSLDEFTVSSSAVLTMPEQGDIKWTEADAPGILAASSLIDKLKAEIDSAGMELSIERAMSNETATGRLLDAATSNSLLKSICTDLGWSLYSAFVAAGQFLNVDATDADISLDTTYTTILASNNQDLTLLIQLFEAGIITNQEFRFELAARNIFVSEQVTENLKAIINTNNL